ncbi:MAG: helix-turn-helix transcriptional regulator [Clostridiales bacterium]|nr:helix-turn-helix transcriptional regulator [Clostridiales bacterium]
MKFEEKLMELRRSRGWSQEELGGRLGVTRQTVSKWELGQTTPDMDKLVEMSTLLDIGLDELLDTPYRRGEGDRLSRRWHFEYKSRRKLFGLPLVHIHVGGGLYRARGIVAIGMTATGLLSVGLLSVGLLSFGVASLGLLAVGAFALGGVAVGAVAVGLLAVGAIAVGLLAVGALSIGLYAVGGCAAASRVALGGWASAPVAIGERVNGTIVFPTDNHLRGAPPEAVREAILREFPHTFRWIADLFAALVRP